VEIPGALVFSGSVAVTAGRDSGKTEKRRIAEMVFSALEMLTK
jgi:hypothetical protein